tara:strand:- start:891 stop:1463 length:573 start_codon:yes stop_codon:yes gene_type:complete
MSSKGGFTKGPSHDDGGIKMTVKSTGQKIEVEGGEGIINKHSMADNRRFKAEGTPRQIASAINTIDGNGIDFDTGGSLQKLAKGGEIYNLYVSDRYAKNRNKYELYADDRKIGSAVLRRNHNYRNMIDVKSMKIDDDFRHKKTYDFFMKEILNKKKKTGAVMKYDCMEDDCYTNYLGDDNIDDNGYLIIR